MGYLVSSSMISLPKTDKPRTRRLEGGEKERLLQGANPELNRIIILALETGMRREEIPHIKKSHINFPKSVLFIPSTKTNEPRSIPLSTDAITSLRGQMRASQRVFGGAIPLYERPFLRTRQEAYPVLFYACAEG